MTSDGSSGDEALNIVSLLSAEKTGLKVGGVGLKGGEGRRLGEGDTVSVGKMKEQFVVEVVGERGQQLEEEQQQEQHMQQKEEQKQQQPVATTREER